MTDYETKVAATPMSRMTDLVEAAADAMDQGEDPFHHSFLVTNDVTLDEAYDMSERLALAARLWLLLSKPEHRDELAALTVELATGDAALAGIFKEQLDLNRITKALRDA